MRDVHQYFASTSMLLDEALAQRQDRVGWMEWVWVEVVVVVRPYYHPSILSASDPLRLLLAHQLPGYASHSQYNRPMCACMLPVGGVQFDVEARACHGMLRGQRMIVQQPGRVHR